MSLRQCVWAAVSLSLMSFACGSSGGNSQSSGIGTTGGAPGSTGGTTNGGSTNVTNGGSGAVMNSGPPCPITQSTSLSARTDVELLGASTNGVGANGSLVANQYGIFWTELNALKTMPLAGGPPSTLVNGKYSMVQAIGSELLFSEVATSPKAYYRASATSPTSTIAPILNLTSSETALVFDEAFAYLYDSGAHAMTRASLTDGTRATVVSDLASVPDNALVYGDSVYYSLTGSPDHIMKVSKSGGPSSDFCTKSKLWNFTIVDDQLIMGANSSEIYIAPLSDPSNSRYIAELDGGAYIKTLILSGSNVYVIENNNGFGWVNLQGTRCEGLFSDNKAGKQTVYNGFLYIEQNPGLDLTFSRLKLP